MAIVFPCAANSARRKTGQDGRIENIGDMRQIDGFGAMTTHAVVIGDRGVHKGIVPSQDQILAWME